MYTCYKNSQHSLTLGAIYQIYTLPNFDIFFVELRFLEWSLLWDIEKGFKGQALRMTSRKLKQMDSEIKIRDSCRSVDSVFLSDRNGIMDVPRMSQRDLYVSGKERNSFDDLRSSRMVSWCFFDNIFLVSCDCIGLTFLSFQHSHDGPTDPLGSFKQVKSGGSFPGGSYRG